jgi:hypothetical protein
MKAIWNLKAQAACLIFLLLTTRSGAEQIALFSYFVDNGNSGVYLAYSTDGRKFQPLNNGEVVFTPPQWPNNQVLTRDPSIAYHDGLFHMVWTSDWSGRVFGYANSPDLVQWSDPIQVTPFPPSLPLADQPINTWAPEIHYDHVQANYQIVFSSTTRRERDDGDGSEGADYDNNDHRLYEVRTTDFHTFTPATRFFDHGYSVIDGHVVWDAGDIATEADDRWIMAIKREKAVWEGGKNIRFTFNDPAKTNGWSDSTEPVLGANTSIRPETHAEGPALVRLNGEWLLYADAYVPGYYALASSPDLLSWADETDNLSLPASPGLIHHGTVFLADPDDIGWRLGARSDLDEDGQITIADWTIFVANHRTDMTGLGPQQSAMLGDLDVDGDNDFHDFRLFRSDYIAVQGAAAFAALFQVPEPTTALLTLLLVCGASGVYLRHLREQSP